MVALNFITARATPWIPEPISDSYGTAVASSRGRGLKQRAIERHLITLLSPPHGGAD